LFHALAHDATILSRALIADVLLPVALLTYAPIVFARTLRA